MPTHKYYVPILKTKQGELWALRTLKAQTRRLLTPLLELHRHKQKAIEDHAADIADALVNSWDIKLPFYLDTAYYGVDDAGASALTQVFDAMRENGLVSIPVIGPERSGRLHAAVRAIARQDGRGALIRAHHGDINANFSTQINSTLAALGVKATELHLLLDYRSSDLNLPVHLPRIPYQDQWRTLTVASGSFPHSIGGLSQRVWHDIPREEWSQWLAQSHNANLKRRLAFGDYATRDPGRPADHGSPSVNIRYTCRDKWIARVGGKLKDGRASDMHAICRDLVANRPEYSGRDFSQGDEEFDNCASRMSNPGGATQWTQWSLSHHLEFVANQVRRLT